MKRTVIAALALVLSASVAQAYTEWRGSGRIVGLSQTCLDVGWKLGVKGNLRFRPANVGDNVNWSAFSTLIPYFAWGVGANGAFKSNFRRVKAFGVGPGGYGPVPGAKFRLISVSPSNFTADTKTIKVVAEFTNYATDVGCTARWKGKLNKQ